MTVERDITRALFNRVKAMAQPNGAWPEAVAVSWMNNAFKPPTGKYLRVFNMINPADRQDISRGRYHRFEGILQVSVMLPENSGDPFREAVRVIDYFPPDLILIENAIEVRITARPDLGPFLQGAPHWEQPVNIHWQAMVTTS